LSDVNADLRLSAARLKARDFVATDVAATVNLSKGYLVADVASMELGTGGRGTVQFSVDSRRSRAKCRLLAKLEGVDLAYISKPLFGTKILSGRGELTANLTGVGLNRIDLLNTLSGKLEVESNKMVGVEINLAKLVEDLKTSASPNGKRDDPQAATETSQPWSKPWAGTTEISNLKASVLLERGKVIIDDLQGRTGNRSIAVRGTADIPKESVELDLFIGDKAKVATESGDISDTETAKSTSRPAVPADAIWQHTPANLGFQDGDLVRFRGNWSHPNVAVEPIADLPLASPAPETTVDLSRPDLRRDQNNSYPASFE
ncbi:MAG: AsmA-like C-terminal region-containing protein, partial [Pseudomonadota bacterium]